MKIYIDGKYYDKENAKISVFDHGLLYGDGIFEGIRIYNSRVFKLKEHIKRLYMSAKAINLDIGITPLEMEKIVLKCVHDNNKKEGYIRLLVTRGVGDLGIDPSKCEKASIIIITADISLYPAEYYEKGIAVITASARRVSSDSLDPRIKSLNYLNNIMAKLEAKQAGCLEAVILNKQGYVTECSADNIFIIKSGCLISPKSNCGSLEGITRETVFEIADTLSIKSREEMITNYDLYTSDECFITGSGAEIMPVTVIDGRKIGDGKPGKLTLLLMKEFKNRIMN
jgi:branched-chain amino acid aminotransferase